MVFYIEVNEGRNTDCFIVRDELWNCGEGTSFEVLSLQGEGNGGVASEERFSEFNDAALA